MAVSCVHPLCQLCFSFIWPLPFWSLHVSSGPFPWSLTIQNRLSHGQRIKVYFPILRYQETCQTGISYFLLLFLFFCPPLAWQSLPLADHLLITGKAVRSHLRWSHACACRTLPCWDCPGLRPQECVLLMGSAWVGGGGDEKSHQV